MVKGTSIRPIAAQEFVRKMRGGSQSCLLRAKDGNFYVVKMLENPQGSRVLFHEAFGTSLMRQLGLHVPHWSVIEVSERFIQTHPGIWFESAGSDHYRPPAGLHFGSQLVAADDGVAYEILPKTWFPRVANRAHWIGALLFDLWAGQNDRRQAIFTADKEHRRLQAVFIDQGCLFSAFSEAVQTGCIRSMFADTAIYAGLDIDTVLPFWEKQIHNLNFTQLQAEFDQIGSATGWYTPDIFQDVASELIRRQGCLEDYSSSIRRVLCGESLIAPVASRSEQIGDVQLHGSELGSERHQRANRAAPSAGEKALLGHSRAEAIYPN